MSTTEAETKTTLQPGEGTGPGAKRRKRPGGHSVSGSQRGRSGMSRLTLRNWRVPTRLTALILVPTIVGVLLAGLRVVSSIDSVASLQRSASAARIAGHLRELSVALGLERDRSTWYQTNRQQKAPLSDQRKAVDASIAKVRDDLKIIDSGYGVRAVEDAQQVGNRLDTMAVIRKNVQPVKYTDVIASLLQLHDEIGQAYDDPQLVGDSRGLSALAHAKEEVSEQRGTLIGTLQRGQRFTSDTLEEFIASRSRQKGAITTFNGEAGADNSRFLAQTVRGNQVVRAELTKSWAIALASRNLPVRDDTGPVAIKQWFDDSTKTIQALQQVEARVAASLTSRGSALESTERRNAIIAGILILALILLVLATTVLIARSLVRPLRRLRSEALEIAGFRLPAVVRTMRESGNAAEAPDIQPILVGTHDEIGEVATAFDEVHRQALRLAAEESQLRGNVNAMFVNLSRRIQTLVERQISLIDGLERGEQDGGRLSDLFKLDHLATRMRRNSENLLVLAGHEAARKRSQPAKLVDVVRAALSEVEDYERVSVKVHRSSAVAGHAANDMVHLIAELVENALAFSPGNTRVVVSSSMIEGGGALLAISDAGIGMAAEEIAEINRRLADPPVVDVSVSRRMGLFVVGRLALRHGIRVQLRRGDSAGLIAMVLFPPQLISVAAGRAPVMPQDATPVPSFGGSAPVPNGSFAPFEGATSGYNGGGNPPAFNGRAGSPARGGAPAFDGGSAPSGAFPVFGGSDGPDSGFTGPLSMPGAPERRYSPATGPAGGTPGTGPVGPPFGPVGPPFGPVGPSTGPSAFGPPAGPSTDSGPSSGANDLPTRAPHGSTGATGLPPRPPADPAAGPATGPVPRAGDPFGPAGSPTGPVRRHSTGPAGPPTGPGGPSRAPAGPSTGPGRPSPRPAGGPPTGPVPGASESLERGDEFLPIFASVESAWFRRPDVPESAGQQQAQAGQDRSGEASGPARHAQQGRPQAPEPSREAPAAGAWASTADSGWQAADAAKDPSLGGITAAGLPKRTPKANLVPGSVAGPSAAPAAPAPRPEVSADLVRARMSRFQQGIQRGRADISETTTRNPDSDQQRTD